MEDNYYKKGKDSSQKASESENKKSQGKGRARTQLNRHSLKTNYNELGKGRIVESSQSGFAVSHPAASSKLQQQKSGELWRKDGEQTGTVAISSNEETNQTVRGPGPLISKDMSANSNNQRRGARHSHDHFATLHQTPQPVVQVGGSGSSTPLTHLIQRRQFEMTQLPKSSSTVSANAAESYTQQHVLAMHLQNPKITSKTRANQSASKKMATMHNNIQNDIQPLDKNMSTLSGGNLNSHSRKVSGNSTALTKQNNLISKPQGGVFQSGPSTSNKMKTGTAPHNILTNNFILGSNPAMESPQFILHTTSNGNDATTGGKFNFATQMIENQGGSKSAASLGTTTDHLKTSTPNQEQLAQQKILHVQGAGQLQSASNAKTNTLNPNTIGSSGGGGGIAALSLNNQHSCGAPLTAHASHFNTPSNCYQAQQQQQITDGLSNNYLLQQQRQSLQTHGSNSKDPQPMASVLSTQQQQQMVSSNNEVHHLSQNSYEMTAPLHMSTSQTPVGVHANRHASIISNTQNTLANLHHQHSNSTLIANLVNQAQNTSAQNLPQHQTTAHNLVNFTQHTQQAHPNLQAAVQLQQQQMNAAGNGGGANQGNNQMQAQQLLQPNAGLQSNIQGNIVQNNNAVAGGGGQGHLSASQFDISALLRQQPSTTANQPVLDFQELCSNTTHNAGAALKMSVEANARDIDFLRQRFYAEYCYDTNDIVTLYTYFQQNFQSFMQPVGNNGNQTTTINALQIANMSSYRQNPQHHHTITGPTGTKSTNVTAFGIVKSRHTTVNQHQTINFNSQSFDNQTMTTSHIQPRKVTKLLEIGAQMQAQAQNHAAGFGQVPAMQTQLSQVQDVTGGGGQDSTEIKHFTTGSVGAGYTPFENGGANNQQMFFMGPSQGGGNPGQQDQVKGRRTQPCLRHHSTVSNRNNCTDTVSFHRDVPTPMMQREPQASVEAEDEKNEFSFEEPAIDGTNEHSIEDEEKSLINALSFKKQIIPLADGQNLHEIDNQRGWATTKQETTPSLPDYNRNGTRPLSKDQCGFTIQLSPINRFTHESKSKQQSVFEFYARHHRSSSILNRGMLSAKRRIKKKGSTNKDGARKHLHRHLTQQSKTLSVLTRGQQRGAVYKLKTALQVIYLNGGTQLAIQEHFKRMLPKNNSNFDSNDNKTVNYRDAAQVHGGGEQRNHSDIKRRRDKSTKGRGTSKSRKRQGSRNSRKQRIASLYRDSTSSIGDESASLPMFTHMSKEANKGDFINVILPVSEVVHDAETTQDIQKLCKEIEDAEKKFVGKLNQDEVQFDKQMTQQVVQAERALQESKRESQTRELSMRGTRRENQLSLAANNTNGRANGFKAQSLSSLNQAVQMPLVGVANATQRHLQPSELYGTEGNKNAVQYAQTNDPVAPNTERPNAQSIEMRLALHHQTQQQQVKGEPSLLKPKKLALDRQQVKLFGAFNTKAQSAQKELETQFGIADETDISANKTPNALKSGTNMQSLNAMQSSNSMNSKRKLTFIKTKNINFHSLNKLSGRMQPSATSTHQAAPGLRIKLQKTANGDCSTDRSGTTTEVMRFGATTQNKSALNTNQQCQSALATHKHTGKDLTAVNLQQMMAKKTAAQSNKYHQQQLQQQHSSAVKKNEANAAASKTATLTTEISGDNHNQVGVTPDKPTCKIKYASARIKLLRVDTSADDAGKQQTQNEMTSGQQTQQEKDEQGGSPTSSATSTLGGYKHMRRLVEMLINEFYRKRGKSIKTVPRDNQVSTLVDFWWQSLSQQKILGKLKGKLAKTGLVEKEKHLMNFLNGKDTKSLLTLQKHSTTRKYGELAVVEEQVLRLALDDYLTKSQ